MFGGILVADDDSIADRRDVMIRVPHHVQRAGAFFLEQRKLRHGIAETEIDLLLQKEIVAGRDIDGDMLDAVEIDTGRLGESREQLLRRGAVAETTGVT